jgi:hypothetical protein
MMEGWTLVKSSASLSPSPPLPPPPPQGDAVEYSWMLGGKRIPLGFAAQPLGPCYVSMARSARRERDLVCG